MPTVKYKCSNCSHIELNKGWKYNLKMFFICITVILAVTGFLSFWNFFALNVYDNPDKILTITWFFEMSNRLYNTASLENQELKIATDELTSNCHNDLCKLQKVFANLTQFDYDEGNDWNATQIWREQTGDCDELANLAIQMLKTQKIKGNLVTNFEGNHAYAVFFVDDKKYKMDALAYVLEEI